MASNEAKVTLSFKLNGKVFSCEGNPANKERHFFDLARQRQVPEEEICTPYRENFPDRANDDDGSIIIRYKARLEKAKKRMAQKETKKEEEAPAAPAESSSTTPMKNKSTTQVVAINLPESQPLSLQSNHLHAQSQGHFERRHSTPMSPDEVRDLNQFITAVLSEDRGGGGAPITNSVVPALEIPGAGSEMRRSVSDLTGEGAGGDAKSRITIFLQQDGVESQKMITIKPGAPFSEVAEMANKKIGSSVALSFVDSDGMRIDVDDDDSFEIFMEQGLKKLTLKCNPVCLTARGPHPSSNSPRGGSLGPAHMNNLIDMPSQNFGNAGSETARERNGATKNTKALVRTFLGHTAAVYGCAFSPDGTTVVSASRDRTLRIWSVERGITLQTIKAHNGFVLSCDYSPRGTHVASSSDDQQIRLFSVSGKKNYTIKEHTDKVYGICFAPHGDIMMSCSCDATVRVWNVETGSRLASIKPHEKPIFRIGLSRTDNARYAVTSSDDQTSALVHWKDGRVVRKLVGHKGTVWSSAFSSDDRYVVTSSMDHSIKVWDTGSGQEICTLLGHNTPVHRAMFADVSSIAESSPGISSNEIIISCAKDRTISAWDVNSATLIYAHSGHHHTVYDLAQSGRNLVSASFDCTLRLWNTKDVICPGL